MAQQMRRCSARPLWFLVCGFFVALLGEDLWCVKAHPEDYAYLWGAEAVAGLWQYSSETAYLACGFALAFWFLAGMLLCLRRAVTPAILLSIHIALSLMWVISALVQNFFG